MLVYPLPLEEAVATGFTHKAIVTHEDLTETVANTAQTIPLLAVGAGTYADRAAHYLVTPFEDLSDAAFNSNLITVGDDGDVDRLLCSNTAGTGLQINRNGTEVLYHINPVAASAAGLATAPFMYTVANTIDLVVGSMAAKSLVDIDAGELHIYLNVRNLVQG